MFCHIWGRYRKLMATLDSYFRKDTVYLHDKLVQGKTVIKKCMFITDLLSDFRQHFLS